jgi:hypothetical protein
MHRNELGRLGEIYINMCVCVFWEQKWKVLISLRTLVSTQKERVSIKLDWKLYTLLVKGKDTSFMPQLFTF